jgi:hypothetical protein
VVPVDKPDWPVYDGSQRSTQPPLFYFLTSLLHRVNQLSRKRAKEIPVWTIGQLLRMRRG